LDYYGQILGSTIAVKVKYNLGLDKGFSGEEGDPGKMHRA
jgi:hypothetical protein